MKFKTCDLVAFFEEGADAGAMETAKIISDEQVDTRRWESVHRIIFELDGRHYQTHVRRPLTECQVTENCGYHGDEQECPEVERYEKTVTDWRVIS